jgi:hypothetical protein
MQVYTGFVWLKTQTTFDGLVVANTTMMVCVSMKVQHFYSGLFSAYELCKACALCSLFIA